MIDYTPLYEAVAGTALAPWLHAMAPRLEQAVNASGHGHLPKWRNLLQTLSAVKAGSIDLNAGRVRIGESDDCDVSTRDVVEQSLRQLHPWRKGPFFVFGIPIDTEWRSDWKWERVVPHIQPLSGRRVLDVGCGNGYHCWRMLGAGAATAIGIDPFLLYTIQFEMLRRFTDVDNAFLLPLGLEDLGAGPAAFDTVFSMGVLYHRRSPLDHLLDLQAFLRPGGELVLETLVVDGGMGHVLVPEGRYAKMRNVWFIPSCLTLESWLRRCGYENVRVVDVTRTTTDEQRRTDWMTFESLADFLDPNHPGLTVEGLPAPQRATVLASRPA